MHRTDEGIEEREMSTQAAIQTQVTDVAPAAAAPSRKFVYPTVRGVALPTAHPAAEAWPIVAVSDAVRAPATQTTRRRRPEADNAERFVELQTRMAQVEAATAAGAERSLVVVPSRTLETWHDGAALNQAFEERLLCTLLELRDPSVRVAYVTSSVIAPSTINYYLSLLPRRIRSHARSRLALVALNDSEASPLSQKLLDRPRALERLRRMISRWPACHLVPYNTTSLERDVALALDIPMYGADPRHAYFGTKSGCRELFAAAGVAHPAGAEGITSVAGAVAAILRIRATRPDLSRMVLKCNEGVSGDGNAIVDLRGLPAPGASDEAQRVAERLASLAPEAAGVSPAAFLAKLEHCGGVVEEWIAADQLASPSVQLQVTPCGDVRLLSTHDQILGGPTGQTYLGCRFPAEPSYAHTISAQAHRVGERLAEAGVIGRFAIDFVVAREANRGWRPYAIEVNLRKGGTTHPYETLTHLTGGTYDPESAVFTTPTGQTKHYVATDHLEADELRRLGRTGVLGLARRGGLRFNAMQRTGAVFHMLCAIDELGRTGFTAIANSAHEADELYVRIRDSLISRACQVGIPRGASRSPGQLVAQAA
jgi:hypothetical protein